jgi:hypothetical protein
MPIENRSKVLITACRGSIGCALGGGIGTGDNVPYWRRARPFSPALNGEAGESRVPELG